MRISLTAPRCLSLAFYSFLALILIAPRLLAATGTSDLRKAPREYATSEKAFYADPRLVAFVRPGLTIKITGVVIDPDGTVRATVKLSDPRGLPLDRDGVYTPGPVSTSFLIATIPAGQTQYTSYVTRVATSTITNKSATQAAADSGGTYKQVADGTYEYTFRQKLSAGFDKTATHTVGVYGSRNLSEFDLGTNYDDDTFNFVPDGSTVKTVRDVARTATCNACHDPLSAHGGARRSVELCVLCHTPQTVDPDTGNTVDFPVMVHKIHDGSQLPSVKAGGKYQIIGFNNSVADYSDVVFPADPRNCASCHKQNVAQKDAFLKPSRAACGSCHDDVNFATGENHADLPQTTDNLCANCHIPQGEIDFDVSIYGAHQIPRLSAALPGTVFEILKVDDGVAGKRPVVTFSVKDKAGQPILLKDVSRLNFDLAGPTGDYQSELSEDPRATATGGGGGVYTYTFKAAIPADAKGSYAIAIEGYRNVTLLPGTRKQVVVRDAGVNKVVYFSVDGSPLAKRRAVVDQAKCMTCHNNTFSFHGDNRNTIETCVLCHNPNGNDSPVRPAAAGPVETIDFRTMIHKIHTGKELANDYTIYGFGGSKNSFNDVGYPGDRRDCLQCHVSGTEQVPTKDGLLDVPTPRGYLAKVGPQTAACTSCHDGRSAASHALANTTPLGESCATCHSATAEFSVNRVHAR